jgi:hypothetical protein
LGFGFSPPLAAQTELLNDVDDPGAWIIPRHQTACFTRPKTPARFRQRQSEEAFRFAFGILIQRTQKGRVR